MWKYEQRSGAFYRPNGERLVLGYAGHGEGVNNPELESTPDVGPIPKGLWQIGPAFTHQKAGPVTMRLQMQKGSLFGRSGFLIHGDNPKGDRSASNGCIILPRWARLEVAGSTVKSLLVVA